MASATETVTLVLGEDQLGALTSSQEPTLLRAQQLCSDGIPERFLPSRVYLVNLAEATQELVAKVRHDDMRTTPPTRRWAWWKPQPNVLRGVVFALALACLMWTASVPQT
ncbi:hypothetical protein M4J06_003685 [Streptomyces coelicoflavus]|uniref:hypothetical protein n=1 Tax=Streptomyces coelicoflavus TaxID=285562 RepID=UPI00210EDED7|nr:hypothetical protein [Streptomyces coelicoflavus]MCQ4200270.1 hypothetical protein [Streptomyces coelicoflavus]